MSAVNELVITPEFVTNIIAVDLADETTFTTADKAKLNGIEAGAQVNTVTRVAGKTGAVELDAGDIAYDASETYASGKIGAALKSAQEKLDTIDAGDIGYDGSTTYDTGTVGEKLSELNRQISDDSSIISANLMGIDVQENLYPGAADWSGVWLNSDSVNMGVSDVTFEGYPTVYSSKSWRRYCKNIPVEAGKTYTFEAWIKHATAGTVFIYLYADNLTVNPATVTPAMKQWNDTPANTWTKLSVTFSCTESGNVTPFALSGISAFYIAKYNLVEGNSVFSLDDALQSKASTASVSGVGDYAKYTFELPAGSTGIGQYWNKKVSDATPSGTKCKLIFDYYSGTGLNYVRVDGEKSDGTYDANLAVIYNPIRGGSAEFVTANNYVGFRIQFYRQTAETGISAAVFFATSKNLGISGELLNSHIQKVFHIEKDGTGDFSSFVDGINAACQYMDSIVYVGAGTFDLLAELGTDYIKSAGGEKKGLVLKNRVRVVCSSQTVLSMNNDQSLYDTEQQYLAAKEYLSPINTGEYGCTLENATIIDNNVRYSIHDDRGWAGAILYTNKFINCTLIHKNGMYGDCIGGGLGENCEIEIRGCYLEGDSNVQRLAYYHGNNHTGVTNAKGNIVVADNYFAGAGAFYLQKYGDSTEMTTALVSNNSFGSAPQVITGTGTQDNMRMFEWNNVIRT